MNSPGNFRSTVAFHVSIRPRLSNPGRRNLMSTDLSMGIFPRLRPAEMGSRSTGCIPPAKVPRPWKEHKLLCCPARHCDGWSKLGLSAWYLKSDAITAGEGAGGSPKRGEGLKGVPKTARGTGLFCGM